jgi:hypothetical protein
MRSSRLGFVLALGALSAVLAGCGGGGSGAVQPAGVDASHRSTKPTPVPPPAPGGSTAVTRVQHFAYMTASTASETSSTVPLGSTGSAGHPPSPGNMLVAIITLDDAGGAPQVTAPPGWTKPAGAVIDNAWSHHIVETYVVPAAPPGAVTFTYNESAGAIITIVEVANTSGVDTITSAKDNVGAPWSTTSGGGPVSATGDLALAVFSVADGILTPSVLSGYTTLNANGRHGDGFSNYGHTVGVYAANAVLSSNLVAAQTISWANGAGTEPVIGQQILMKPASAGPTAAPSSSAAPTASPAPTATPKPTPAPTPTPTAAPVSAAPPNGYAWPASFVPFGPTSPWNTRIVNPTYTSDSAAIIAAQFPGPGLSAPVRNDPAGQWDQAHPIYFASASDPLINVNCVAPYCTGIPSQIRIPARGLFGQSLQDDSHIGVVQPDGTEYDMYCWDGNSVSCGPQQGGTWSTGQTVTPGYGAACGNIFTGSGIQPLNGSGTTAGGACESAGLLNPNELAAGAINHALFLITACTANGGVAPARNQNTNACPGVGPKLGYRLYYDVPDATTNANPNLKPWEKAILNALHDYGGYVMDDIGGGPIDGTGVMFQLPSGEPALAYGLPDQWAQLQSQGWTPLTVPGDQQMRWIGADPWNPSGVNFNQHLHYINYP